MIQGTVVGSGPTERVRSGVAFAPMALVSTAVPSFYIPQSSLVAQGISPLSAKASEDVAGIPQLDDSTARGKTWYSRTVEQVVNILWAIILSRAMADQFPIDSGRVLLTTSPESRHNRVVLAIFARKASAAQTIPFWNSLEPNFQQWLSTANSAQVKEFLTRVSPHFYWGNAYR